MKKFKLFILMMLLAFNISDQGHADVLGIGIAATGKVASSVITGETVKSLVESARREAKALIAESENTGNVLLTRAADELNLTADNIERIFAKNLKSTFEEVDEDKRDLLIGLASATKVAAELGDKAYDLKDTLSLDVRSIMGDVPFVKESLVLQRVSGLSIISGKDKIKLKVIGSYVGLPGEDHRTDMSLSINGKTIDGIEIDPVEIHMAYLYIPSNNLSEFLLKEKPTRIPLTIYINQKFLLPQYSVGFALSQVPAE